jgi:hypothetical protein
MFGANSTFVRQQLDNRANNSHVKGMVLFSRLIIRTFQLVFPAGTVFFSQKNQQEQYFSFFFSISEQGSKGRTGSATAEAQGARGPKTI